MDANRGQIRLHLELQRLRRLIKQKEYLLTEQQKLCDGPLHDRLLGQYKQMIIARQSLASTTSQCKDIGETLTEQSGDQDTFR